jgi:Txe/YoeB family toxin of toxin-antitoxin system
VTWRIVFTRQAKRDAKKLAGPGLRLKAQRLLDGLKQDPFFHPPPYEKLRGDLAGLYSRRINI